jgi:hypothetical protein
MNILALRQPSGTDWATIDTRGFNGGEKAAIIAAVARGNNRKAGVLIKGHRRFLPAQPLGV